MTQEQLDMMASSQSEDEWNMNCERVKKAHGGQYPPDWFMKVILSGLLTKTRTNWSK